MADIISPTVEATKKTSGEGTIKITPFGQLSGQDAVNAKFCNHTESYLDLDELRESKEWRLGHISQQQLRDPNLPRES